MKKLSIKKLTAVLCAAAGLSTAAAGVAGCVKKSAGFVEPDNIEITRLPAPTDGSLPTAHTCAENMAYIHSVFDAQTQYHSYSYGVTSASIATQTTRNFRDYKDGILMTTDLTYSSMVKSGTQTCTVINAEGEPEVYFRTSAAPEADTLPAEAVWSTEAPVVFSEKSYHYTYGLLPTELFNYIVNEQNIIDSEAVVVNGDGTYTQNFTLDPKASTFFYQFGMKTRGGLSGYPEFQSITFSVRFDGNWRILSSTMREVAKVNKGILVDSISDFTTEYWYGDDRFDEAHYNFYKDYFKSYVGDEHLEQGGSVDEELVVDVTNVLSNGFSQIMNGGEQFEIIANLGKNSYAGYVFASLDLADPLGTLALKLSMGKTLKDQGLYVEFGDGELEAYYGDGFALNANLAETSVAVGQLGETLNKIIEAFKSEEVAPDGGSAEGAEAAATGGKSDPLTELMNCMVLESDGKRAVLTLDTDDLLGLGIGIKVNLVFGINNNSIIFRGGSVGNISIGGEKLDLSLTLLATTAPEIGRDTVGGGADLSEYIADINSLLGADLLKVELGLNGNGENVKIKQLKGLEVGVTAYADLDGVTVGAQADIGYTYKGSKVTAKAEVWYLYDPATGGYGSAVVALTDLNGAPADVKIKCDIKEVAEALSTAFNFAGFTGSSDSIVSILNGALTSDLTKLITELYGDSAKIKAGISVDAILDMLGVNAGVEFGTCALTYERGEGVYGGNLQAALPALGFNLKVTGVDGELTPPDLDGCLDLCYVIEDISEIVQADLIKFNLSLDGDAEGVTVSQLSGVSADVNVYFDKADTALSADAEISYTYDNNTATVALTAWYGKNAAGKDAVVLSLDSINGTKVYADVKCEVAELTEAVGALLDYAGIKISPMDGAGDNGGLDTFIAKILGADFSKLLPELKADNGGMRIALDCDKAIALFTDKVKLSLGNAVLAYDHTSDDKLKVSLPALGLSAGVSGAAGDVIAPVEEGALDLTDLVKVVHAAWKQVDGIKKNESVAFEVGNGGSDGAEGTYLYLDGILVKVWGFGEVSWKKGAEQVVLDLSMSVANNSDADVLSFKFIYDKNATDKPLVRLAMNDIGIDIYREDIDGVVAGFNEIYSKVAPLFGGSAGDGAANGGSDGKTDGGATDGSAATTFADGADNAEGETPAQPSGKEQLASVIFGVLANGDWVNVLNNLTLTCDGKSVALGYLFNADNSGNIEIGTDGALTLDYDGKLFGRLSLGGAVRVSADAGTLAGAVNTELNSGNYKMSSSKTSGSSPFIKLAYDCFFEAIHNISVKNVLGSDTYTVTFYLDGAKTNVEELRNVFINAEIYVTGEDANNGKMSEGLLNLNVKDVVVQLHVITERVGDDTKFYINLSQVMDIKLPDLKFLATQKSLYETFEVLFNTINDTNVLQSLGKFMGGATDGSGGTLSGTPNGGVADGSAGDKIASDETLSKLSGLLSKLLQFNFNEAVIATEEEITVNGEINTVTRATIDLDNIVRQLGIECGSLGTLKANINHNTHSMITNGTAVVTNSKGEQEENIWISLKSELAARRSYAKFDRSEYISIEFLPTLIYDLAKTAIDENGDLYETYTFSGTVNVEITSLLKIKLDVTTLTVDISKENGLYFSLIAKLSGGIVADGVIGLTYDGGYLTLGRYLDTAKPEYKIMTFEYFLDNMFADSSKSSLNYLLGVNSFLWNMVKGELGKVANINSGLTAPRDIYLYNGKQSGEGQEISMYSYVKALRVVIDPTEEKNGMTAGFGDISALEDKLGVSGNYYGFDLNAGKITGGILSKLYAAITRGESGIDAVKAYISIDDIVNVSANLAYRKGLTRDNLYKIGNPLSGDIVAPSLYREALAITGDTKIIDFKHSKDTDNGREIFGCFTTSDKSNDYSVMLKVYNLTIVYPDGTRETREVRVGSTVYLYDNNAPVYTDKTNSTRIIYSVKDGEIGGKTVKVEGDLTVYAVTRDAVKVYIHSGEKTYEVDSFVGDKVPTEVKDMERVGAVRYDSIDGIAVSENDYIKDKKDIHLYGVFANSSVTVNYVKYTFNASDNTYIAAGKAAGFNDHYSVRGNTLILENAIDGYPVTAIADSAFANDIEDSKPIKRVIVPENIRTIGASAFKDNYGMLSAVFLADSVTMNGSDKNVPFYGCSRSSSEEKINNIKQNEITDLKLYYNTVTNSGKAWRLFRGSKFYIGETNGGALYGAGEWRLAEAKVNVNLNGVAGTTLTADAVKGYLSDSFPLILTPDYEGSVQKAQVESALQSRLTAFNVNGKDGVNYTCSFTTSVIYDGCRATVTFNVSFKKAAVVNVLSPVAFTYYGVNIAADTLTTINIPMDGDALTLADPACKTHIFTGWDVKNGENGEKIHNVNWRKRTEYTLSVKFDGNWYATFVLTMPDGSTTSQKTSVLTGYSTEFKITVLEGQTITASCVDKSKEIIFYADGEFAFKFESNDYGVKEVNYNSGVINGNINLTFKF